MFARLVNPDQFAPSESDKNSSKKKKKKSNCKRDYRVGKESEVSINAGLPTPDDRLGKSTGKRIPGTLGSSTY